MTAHTLKVGDRVTTACKCCTPRDGVVVDTNNATEPGKPIAVRFRFSGGHETAFYSIDELETTS